MALLPRAGPHPATAAEDLEGDASAQVLPAAAQVNTGTIPAYSLSIDEVCTTANSQTVLIASGKPLRPSHTTIQTSATPRFLVSVRARIRAFSAVTGQIPRMSRSPLTVTLIATYIGLFVTCPSRTFT